MPVPTQNLRTATHREALSFELAPAHNASLSLLLINEAEELSGLDEWIGQAYRTLSEEQRKVNRLVMVGFYSLATPQRDYASFPDFIDDLASRQPEAMRSQLLERIARGSEREDFDEAQVLESADSYIAFLQSCYPKDDMQEEVERQAYEALRQPAEMQSLIVDHLRMMWAQVLAPEWQQTRPMLEEAVKANQQTDYSQLDRAEALRQITGRDLDRDYLEKHIMQAEHLVFVPSPHVGPYVSTIMGEDTTWILFGARLPEGARVDASALSRAQILVRLGALADDTRLQILRMIAERGEMRSQEVMDALDLSQSACSRHLKQLSATGYLIERRCSGAKCYVFNPQRVENTLEALGSFLLERTA